MKKLNPSYFKFFFSRYGSIVIGVHAVTIFLYIYTKEKDPFYLAMPSFVSFLLLVLICSSEYLMLRKNIPPANVFMSKDSLLINGISYPAEQINEINYMPVSNALNKFTSYFFEIKTNDGAVFYFLGEELNWKGKSPTMKLLNTHPIFSLKTKEKNESSNGFAAFKKQKQS